MEPFSFHLDPGGTHLVISIFSQRMDATQVSGFRNLLESVWKPEVVAVTIDLSRVEFMDSSGIGALLTVQRKLKGGGQAVALQNISPNILQILTLLRLDKVFALNQAGSG